jgi:hypothetical protein
MSVSVIGERYAGPVDRVPGRCYVVTRVFHINNLPLIPLGGLLVIEGTESKTFISGITTCDGVEIPVSGKSFACALARAVMFLGGLLSLLGMPVILLDITGPAAILCGPLLGVALLLLWFMTRKGFHASPERANELLAILDGSTARLPTAIARQRVG